MAEHEPLDIADKDAERDARPEARAARVEGTTPAGRDTSRAQVHAGRAAGGNDAAAAASEPMELQRLPDSGAPAPPGRQRTGDPPTPRRSSASDDRS